MVEGVQATVCRLQLSSGLASGKAGETLQGNTRVGNSSRSCRQVERNPQATNAREDRLAVAVGLACCALSVVTTPYHVPGGPWLGPT